MSRVLALVREGVRQAVRHPLRGALTAATSAVAIAVTVNVISLVHGMDEDLRRDVSRFGRTTVDVGRFPVLFAGRERAPLGPEQGARIERLLADLRPVLVPRRQTVGKATGTATVAAVSVIAAPEAYLRTLDVPLLAGRWMTEPDGPAATCALDRSAAAALFPGKEPADVVGETVLLERAGSSARRRVVGVLEDPLTYRALFEEFDEGSGARTLTNALLSFRNVYVPLEALPDEEWSGISVVLPDVSLVDEAARRLRTLHPPTDPDPLKDRASVGVWVRKDWMEAIGSTTSQGALLGNLVWIVIVGVAMVMITTLALTTIRERYDEIAVRRCEGARRLDVAVQVTAEGTLTALAGGLVGLPLGALGAVVLRRVVDFPFRFEARWAVVATAVALALGLVASLLPARRAARLDPAKVLARRET
jgi:putative ABC transport system permease protein